LEIEKMKNIFENKKGFNLIEMMVSMAILGLIILGLVTFFTGGTKAWIAGQSQLKAQREARQAIDRMVREIREGKNVKTGSDDDTIVIFVPALGSEDAYDVTYNLVDTTINRGGNPLISNVQSLILEYYESDGTPIAPPVPVDNEVSKIHIELQVDVDNDKNPDITLNTDVNLRNYGSQE